MIALEQTCGCGCGKTTTVRKGIAARFVLGHNNGYPPLSERLWARVIRASDDDCWVFTGAINEHGYGRIGRLQQGRSVLVLAHRAAWEVTRGPIPVGMKVLHRCDNPPCVNPKHLFLGTQQDNIQDMLAKGRDRGFRYRRYVKADFQRGAR